MTTTAPRQPADPTVEPAHTNGAMPDPPPPAPRPGLPLDPLQRQAAHSPEGPIIIIGGPGTGKTRTLVSRVKYLLDSGATPYTLTLLTYTSRTAEQGREQMAQVTDEQNIFIGTIHQYSSYFLRQAGAAALGRSPHYTIWDQIQATETIQDLISNPEAEAEGGMTPAEIGDMLQWHGLNQSLLPEDALRPRKEHWPRVMALYEAEKLKQNTLDIDDLTPLAIQAMQADPALRATWSRIRTRHLLVDEFQDLTPRQYQLLQLLTGPTRSITIATDPNQSIYGWRGADIRLFEQFQLDYPKSQKYLLRINHRSTATLADSTVQLTEDEAMTGLQYTFQDPIRPPGDKPVLAVVDGTAKQADKWVINQAQQLNRQGVDWAEMAFIYRRNAVSRRLSTQLEWARVPFHILGDTRKPEDTDAYAIRCLLAFLLNPQDTTALAKAAVYYKGDKIQRIHRSALKDLRQAADRDGIDLLTAAEQCLPTLRRNSPAQVSLNFIVTACPKLAAVLDDPEQSLYQLCIEAQYLLHDQKRAVGPLPRPEPEMSKLLILSEATGPRAGEDSRQTLSRFLEMLNTAPYPDHRSEENDDPTAQQTALTLSSIHAAKGIQWRYVWLLDASDHILPGNIPEDNPAYRSRLEEEQRIFYVASSRAADRMTYVSPTKAERDTQGVPSRFIEALGPVDNLLIETDPDAETDPS